MALQPKWDARPPPAHRPPARRTDNFSKSDNNTLRQILAEGKNICTQAPCISSVTENAKKIFLLQREINNFSSSETPSPPWISNGSLLSI